MELGIRGTTWLICIPGIILCLSNMVSCCSNGTYYSHDLEGCLPCPDSPALHCKGVHRSDISSCFAGCVEARVEGNIL
jgi:hypothetical protein